MKHRWYADVMYSRRNGMKVYRVVLDGYVYTFKKLSKAANFIEYFCKPLENKDVWLNDKKD